MAVTLTKLVRASNKTIARRFEKGVFFVRRAYLDLVNPFRFGVSPRYTPSLRSTDQSMPYVLGYSTKGMLERYDMIRDPVGIVMVRHYIQQGEGYYYSPVKIAHFALGSLNDALNGRKPKAIVDYRAHLAWIMANYSEEFGGVVWRVPSSNPKYDLKFNYVSAISQGLALSLLARAEIGHTRILAGTLSEAALAPLLIPVEDEGLLARGMFGPCFEEYPCVPYSHVVNGFVFCLNGLFDCYSAYGITQAKRLFDLGLDTLRQMTKSWFLFGCARYDLRDLYTGDVPNLATRHYQYLHADQMKGLVAITGDSYWGTMARRFEQQALNPVGIGYSYWCKARKFL